MSTVKVVKKIIINGVEYNLPSWGGGGGGTDTATVNALIDVKLKEFDGVFTLQNGLYQVLNDIDDQDSLWLTAGDTWEDIVEDVTSISLVSNSYAVMSMVVNSDYALQVLMQDSDAIDEMLECWNSATIIAENDNAANLFLNDSTILTKILASSIAKDAFFSSNAAWDVILNNNTLLTTIVWSTTYMADIVNIPVAMEKIVNNADAMQYIAITSSIYALVMASAVAVNCIVKSQTAIDVLTTSSNNTALLWKVTTLYNLVTGDSTRFKQVVRTYQDTVANLNNSTVTKNCIVFVATGYYSSSSWRTIVWHANWVQAKSAGKTYRPTSVTSSNCDVVSFKNCTFTESSNGYAAIAVYQAI